MSLRSRPPPALLATAWALNRAAADGAKVLKAQFLKVHAAQAKSFGRKDLDGWMAHRTADAAYEQKDGTFRDFANLKGFVKGFMDGLEKTHSPSRPVRGVERHGAEARA